MNIRIAYIPALLLLCIACRKEPLPGPGPGPEPDPGPVQEETVDGSVRQIMKASKGKGLDIVLMGDGYILEDHEDGTYEKDMTSACNSLFSNRPLNALKEYFNVWYVGVVSDNRKLDGTSGIKCKGVYPTDNVSEQIIDSYGSKVKDIVVDSTVFLVIINKEANGGWCAHESYEKQKAYAYCPKIPSSPTNQAYRLALIHETMGHGFAKLGDEYVMSGYEKKSPSNYDLDYLDYIHSCGYDLNICYSTNEAVCPWREFLGDERYASENIGFYEGVGYYGKGAYRPTKTNLMNVTTGRNQDFSAPQRKIIYDRVIKRGEGRTPDYEEFTTFDMNNK